MTALFWVLAVLQLGRIVGGIMRCASDEMLSMLAPKRAAVALCLAFDISLFGWILAVWP